MPLVQQLGNREHLLQVLPKNARCAEVGVWRGVYAEKILEFTTPAELVLIDRWRDTDEARQIVMDKFKKNDNVKVYHGDSVHMAENFTEEYFDWVYIDADHRYRGVKGDIGAYYPKVKMGGFLCFHDYKRGKQGVAVVRAVNELMNDNLAEMLYITNEKTPSVMMRKIVPCSKNDE